MSKTKRTARIAWGSTLIIIGLTLGWLDNRAIASNGGFIGSYYLVMPGVAFWTVGWSYLYSMAISPHAGNRSFVTALVGKKGAGNE